MDQAYPPISPLYTGLRNRCPRCGDGRLFKGFLTLAPRCEVCGLDYSFADPADGPAFFSSMVMSFPVLGFIWWLDATYAPPLWVHAVLSLPLLLAACILPLRPLKGWLVCSQYVFKAEQGRLVSDQTAGAAPVADPTVTPATAAAQGADAGEPRRP